MIDAILFDLGDTIINFGIGRKEAEVIFQHGARQSYDYLTAHHKNLPPYARYSRAHYRKMRNAYLWSKITHRDFNYGDVISQVVRALRIPVDETEIRHLAWLWYKPIVDASSIDAGVHDMLDTLRSAGTKLAIVSNTFVPGHCLDRHLHDTGLLEFFPVRIYSSNTRYRKPHPRIFEIALHQVGVAAHRALFIGDLPICDIKGARNAGMKTIWKPANKNPATPLRRHKPDGTIPKITHLPHILPNLGCRAATKIHTH